MAASEILNLDGDSLTWQRGDGAVILDQLPLSNANDSDFLAFGGGSLVVSIVSGGAPDEDRIAIRSTGTGANEIAVAANQVLFEGIAFATFSGGASGDDLVVEFLSTASETAVTELLRALTYENSASESPVAGERQIRLQLTDAEMLSSNAADVFVEVVTGPRITHLSGDVTLVPVNGGAVPIDQGATLAIEDADGDLGGAVLQLVRLSGSGGVFSLAAGASSGGDGLFGVNETVTIGGHDVAQVLANGGTGGDLSFQLVSGATAQDVADLLTHMRVSTDAEFGVVEFGIDFEIPGRPAASETEIVLASVPVASLPVSVVSGIGAVFHVSSIQAAGTFAGDNAVIAVDGSAYGYVDETVLVYGEATTLALPFPHTAFVIMDNALVQPRSLTLLGDGDVDVVGNSRPNDIFGNDGSNEISGLDGADTILGFAGDDILMGQAGNDLIDGGDGDVIVGDEDDDTLLGGAGGDLLVGGQGNDTLYGGSGDDILQGLGDNDTLIGEAGNDLLWGDQGDDLLIGNVGNDTLIGGADNDTLIGDEGSDVLEGGDGNDLLCGGSGDDHLDGGNDADTLQGWTGNDTLDGGSGDDSLWGDEGDDILTGGSGNDGLVGGEGNDIFVFADGCGNDVIDDFTAGAGLGDRLNISDFGFADFNAVLAAADDNSGSGPTVIQLDADDTVTLLNVLVADLNADDFVLV